MPESFKTHDGGPERFEPLPEPLRTLLLNSDQEGATDVHLDWVEEGLLVRFRVDGIIHPKEALPEETGRRLQNQVRVAAGLDTEALFAPVEAQIEWWDGTEERDIRVVVGPTGQGETTHLRLLYAAEKARNLDALGLTDADLEKVQSVLQTPTGLMLVAGQTGAGKTTTLYSFASGLDLETTVAVSIEDPVEFELPLLRQFGVDQDRGLTIFKGLRTLLRMDPDVILVGEIRDQQSAITAARAALAGRLVMASVHAVDAAAAIEALHYLSVPNHIIGGCLRMVVAQNLVRRVCQPCAEARALTEPERELFQQAGLTPPEQVPKAVGCDACNGYGYVGRTGVFETALVDRPLADAITAGATLDALRDAIREAGTPTLLADALRKVAQGVTSMEEVFQFHWPVAMGLPGREG